MMQKNRASTCCFVPGCKTGYQSTKKKNKALGKRNPAVFAVKNKEELDKWCKAIERTDKEMKIGDKVCELHFAEDNIIKYFETLLPDGTVWRIKRTKHALKPGSVPTIFPDFKNVSKKGKSEKGNKKISPEKRKTPKNTYSRLKKKLNEKSEHSSTFVNDKNSESAEIGEDKSSEHSIMAINNDVPESAQIVRNENSDCPTITLSYHGPENVQAIENENSELAKKNLNDTTEAFTYSTLVNNLKLISRPDWSWGISVHDKFIMCAKWDNSTLIKRVVINCNLRTRVFLKSRAIDFDNVKISCIKDLSSILMEVDRCRMCAHVDNKELTGCDGYILPKMQSVLCEYCRLIGNSEVNKKQSMYWMSKGRNFTKHQLLYEKINTLNKKNSLLKDQLSKLIKIKAVWKLSNQSNPNKIED